MDTNQVRKNDIPSNNVKTWTCSNVNETHSEICILLRDFAALRSNNFFTTSGSCFCVSCSIQGNLISPVSGTGSPMSSAVGKLSQKEDMIPRAMQIVINTSAHSVRKFGINRWVLIICPEAPCYLQQSHPLIEKCKAV